MYILELREETLCTLSMRAKLSKNTMWNDGSEFRIVLFEREFEEYKAAGCTRGPFCFGRAD